MKCAQGVYLRWLVAAVGMECGRQQNSKYAREYRWSESAPFDMEVR